MLLRGHPRPAPSSVRVWANELKDRGIRVNAISPGPIDTSGMTELVGEENAPAFKAAEAARIAIGRLGRVEEVAAAASRRSQPGAVSAAGRP